MTPQDLVIAAMWIAGIASGISGVAGLAYYGVAFIRLSRKRRRAGHGTPPNGAHHQV